MARIREQVTDTMDPRLDPQLQARGLYWQGWGIQAIARHIGAKPTTVYSWKNRGNWDGGTPAQRVLASAEAKIIQLINLDKKSDGVYKEINQLSKLIDGFSGGAGRSKEPKPMGTTMPDDRPVSTSTIDNPPREYREQQERGVVINPKPDKNYFADEHKKKLREIFMDTMAPHQRIWFDHRDQRLRDIIKSRQIGATFHFAREGLIEANDNGQNQIFLSASRAQVYQSKLVIMDFAEQVGVELSGEVISLGNNGAKLYFLSTNSRTAQGRTGNLKVDEYQWIPGFKELKKLAGAMASHNPLTTTYYSTAAYEDSEAYTFWSGEAYNEGRPFDEHIKLDVSPMALKDGRLDPDMHWRQTVTIEDAVNRGFERFDLDYLKATNAPEEFRQLYMCEFITAGDSLFPLHELRKHVVDSWDKWAGFFKPLERRPLGNAPVWIGYDPADGGDSQALIVLKAPEFAGDKFRLVEYKILHGNDFEAQADLIKTYLSIYNVQKIIIDTNGLGIGVYQHVVKFFPRAQGLKWNADEKAQMILKMQSIFRQKRFEFDQGANDVYFSFMSIRRMQLKSGRITYGSNRTEKASHGDVAWAIIMTIAREGLADNFHKKSSIKVIK